MSFGQILKRNVNTGRGRPGRRCLARHFLNRTGNREFQVADLDWVADLGVELKEQTFFENRLAAVAKFAGSRRWRRFHRTVKRKVAAEGADARETRPAAFRKRRHRREAYFSRLRFA